MKKILSLIIFLASAQFAHAVENSAMAKVEDVITNAITEKGVEGKFKVNINGYENGFNLRDELDSYQISAYDIKLNEKTQNFKTDLAITSADNKTRHYNVTGTYDHIIRVPVLAQKMSHNSTIKETDIAWLEIPNSQIKFDTITQQEKLVGQSLKHDVSDNIPLKERDMQKAQVMARNATVNILFITPTISLKATGIALDNGGHGDTIRVRNSTSNKIIQAIIQDEQNVAAVSENNSLIGKTAKTETENTAKIESENYVR